MLKLEVIKNELNSRIQSGELSFNDAQKVYEAACEKYPDEAEILIESAEDDSVDDAVLTYEATCEAIKDFLLEAADEIDDDLPKSTSANKPGEVDDNDIATKRILAKAAEEIKADYKKAEGISESELALLDSDVNTLKCKVYESYDSGLIDKDTKDAFLYNLDLNNWDI